jgi:hypothetical protein
VRRRPGSDRPKVTAGGTAAALCSCSVLQHDTLTHQHGRWRPARWYRCCRLAFSNRKVNHVAMISQEEIFDEN